VAPTEVKMENGRARQWPLTLAVAVVVASFAGVAGAQVGGGNDSRTVTLTAVSDGAGGCTITVDPDVATISRGKKTKIKKVYWVAEPSVELGELYWELRYDPGKGGGTGDYFGDVDLACGETSIKVQPDKPKIANAEWPYMITVYRCANGAKAAYLCTVDPRIKWDD
jgi:hypothetical protein